MNSWETLEGASEASEANDDFFDAIVWRDLALETFQTKRQSLSVAIERVVSVHILEMRSTTMQESLRALRELYRTFSIAGPPPGGTRLPIEAQTVYYTDVPRTLRPVFISTANISDEPERSTNSSLMRFLEPLANELQGYPEETWRERALAHLGAQADKSAWADAVGLLYSLPGIAAALAIPESEVSRAADEGVLLALSTSEGERLFPVAQVRRDGCIVRGLQWILRQLDDDEVDRYTLAAWMNQEHADLDYRSVWDVLQASDDLPASVRDLVLEFHAAASR